MGEGEGAKETGKSGQLNGAGDLLKIVSVPISHYSTSMPVLHHLVTELFFMAITVGHASIRVDQHMGSIYERNSSSVTCCIEMF